MNLFFIQAWLFNLTKMAVAKQLLITKLTIVHTHIF